MNSLFGHALICLALWQGGAANESIHAVLYSDGRLEIGQSHPTGGPLEAIGMQCHRLVVPAPNATDSSTVVLYGNITLVGDRFQATAARAHLALNEMTVTLHGDDNKGVELVLYDGRARPETSVTAQQIQYSIKHRKYEVQSHRRDQSLPSARAPATPRTQNLR